MTYRVLLTEKAEGDVDSVLGLWFQSTVDGAASCRCATQPALADWPGHPEFYIVDTSAFPLKSNEVDL